MQIVNSTAGKIGSYFVGPKQYLHKDIRLGEVAICIARDTTMALHPYVWIIGGIEPIIDYVSLAKSKDEISQVDGDLILSNLDTASKEIPKTAYERLATIFGYDKKDLKEIKSLIELAQICVTDTVGGIADYSAERPRWIPRSVNTTTTTSPSNGSSIH